mgnify:CR=1 FL=1
MRLDKFLKVTRIIKRRTVAKELADNGNIVVNGDVKKSSYDVKKGDIFEIKYFNKNIKVKVCIIYIHDFDLVEKNNKFFTFFRKVRHEPGRLEHLIA